MKLHWLRGAVKRMCGEWTTRYPSLHHPPGLRIRLVASGR